MADQITVQSVVAMAIDLEKTGRAFYQALASACDDREISTLWLRLASEEAKHCASFARIAAGLPKPVARPSEEENERLHQIVKNAVLPKPAIVSHVALHGKLEEVLAMAIRMEQDSVSFYEGIARVIAPAHKAAVEQIIREEKQHLRDLRGLAV
jgi:rubrerythrin